MTGTPLLPHPRDLSTVHFEFLEHVGTQFSELFIVSSTDSLKGRSSSSWAQNAAEAAINGRTVNYHLGQPEVLRGTRARSRKKGEPYLWRVYHMGGTDQQA